MSCRLVLSVSESESESEGEGEAPSEAREMPASIEIIDDDEEFLDAEEYPSPMQTNPTAYPQQQQQQQQAQYNNHHQSNTQGIPGFETLQYYLGNLGIRPRQAWMQACLEMLCNRQPGFAGMSVSQQAELCLSEFLFSDFNNSCAGVLPPNIGTLHEVELPGPYVLQIDEIVNIVLPLKERYKETPAGSKRCLKLSMTDGVQRVFGIEYRPIKDLMVLLSGGCKIALRNVNLRRGIFMLVPEVIDILGGVVENLEAAREKVVKEVNKPPRGRRNKRGEETPSLVSRARTAAWSSNSSSNTLQNNAATPVTPRSIQSHPEQPTQSNDMIRDLERTHIDDAELEHSLLQDEQNDVPFTYLAILNAKKELEPVVKGTIKGILTGVKEFQFKERDTFDLLVYVDDGSLISEVLIDHKVVENIIGHSPREVTALLASGNQESVYTIKEKMKNFQEILKNFEGKMFVEINDQLRVPIVLEMKTGCQSSDASLLLERVNCLLTN